MARNHSYDVKVNALLDYAEYLKKLAEYNYSLSRAAHAGALLRMAEREADAGKAYDALMSLADANTDVDTAEQAMKGLTPSDLSKKHGVAVNYFKMTTYNQRAQCDSFMVNVIAQGKTRRGWKKYSKKFGYGVVGAAPFEKI